MAGAPGPVTTISATPVRVGLVKSTSFWRSGVTVSCAITMSTLPSTSAGSSRSRGSGTNQKTTFRLPVLRRLLSSSSMSLPYSKAAPRCTPWSTK